MSARNYHSPQRRLISYALLIFFALVYVAPFLIQTATSFKTEPTQRPTACL